MAARVSSLPDVNIISVDLVPVTQSSAHETSKPTPSENAAVNEPAPLPIPQPRPKPPAPRVIPEVTPPQTELDDDVQSGEPAPSTLSSDQSSSDQLSPVGSAPRRHIPSRWALKPPLAKDRLEGLGLLGEDIDCLQSLSDDCKKLRADIFKDYALTEMELVWTPTRSDTGLPSQFYGLSEVEILDKLGVPIAGHNGLSVPLLGTVIDGPIWDAMHGVNKGCKIVRGTGTMGVAKKCPDRLPRPER